MLRYPYTITPEANDTFLVTVTGIPGAFTVCRSEEEARDMALDVALTMLAAMIDDAEDIPAPLALKRGQSSYVELPAMAEVKLAIYQAMRRQGTSQVKLAGILGTDPKSIRRLLDLFHASRWDHLEMALEALGYQAKVTVEPFTPAPGALAKGQVHRDGQALRP
jgi:antitoxin HicB